MQPDHFMHSQSSVRDDYKSWNLGSRNGAVRDVSYAAATQRLEEMGLQSEAWLHELRTIVTQMDIILDCIPSVQVDAVTALQDAMLAILVNAESEDTARRAPACEPTELTRAAEWEGRGLLRRGPGGSVRWSADPRHAALASAHRAVTVLRAPRKSCAGGLMLTRFASCFGLSRALQVLRVFGLQNGLLDPKIAHSSRCAAMGKGFFYCRRGGRAKRAASGAGRISVFTKKYI